MGRLNNAIKNIFFDVNIFLFFIGLVLIGIALYVIFADWGGLDPSFFLGTGIAVALFGLLLCCLCVVGMLGVRLQEKSAGFFTGRRILFLYFLYLIAAIVFEVFAASITLAVISSLNSAYSQLKTGSEPDVTSFEKLIAKKFNDFFFGAASKCADAKYQSFWSWVDGHCPSEYLSQAQCQLQSVDNACVYYSITMCYADQTECDKYSNGAGVGCPYYFCRYQFIDYFLSKIRPLSYVVLVFTIFQCLLFLLCLLLICYNRRDSREVMLYKCGTTDVGRPLSSPRAQSYRHLPDFFPDTEQQQEESGGSIPIPPPNHDKNNVESKPNNIPSSESESKADNSSKKTRDGNDPNDDASKNKDIQSNKQSASSTSTTSTTTGTTPITAASATTTTAAPLSGTSRRQSGSSAISSTAAASNNIQPRNLISFSAIVEGQSNSQEV